MLGGNILLIPTVESSETQKIQNSKRKNNRKKKKKSGEESGEERERATSCLRRTSRGRDERQGSGKRRQKNAKPIESRGARRFV